MKSLNKSTAVVLALVLGLILGGVGVGLYQKHRLARSPVSLDRLFNDDFFNHGSGSFAMMEKLRRDLLPSDDFDQWFAGRFGGSIGEIKTEETEKEVIYRISLSGLDRTSVSVKVQGNQVMISGEKSDVQAEEEKGTNERHEFYQSFSRTFPVPGGTDSGKVKIKTGDDEIVLKFPKKTQKKGA